MPAGLNGQNVLIHGRKQATVRQIHCMYPYILNMYFCVFCILRHQMGSSNNKILLPRGGSRTAATSKMEHFVIIVKAWKLLTIITKRSTDRRNFLRIPQNCSIINVLKTYIGKKANIFIVSQRYSDIYNILRSRFHITGKNSDVCKTNFSNTPFKFATFGSVSSTLS